MKPYWLGPYVIHTQLQKGVLQVANEKLNVLKAAVNQYLLKVYHFADEPVRSDYL